MLKTLKGFLIAAPLMALAACASSGNNSAYDEPDETSAAQEELYGYSDEYSGEYALQGAAIGAILGAAVTCILIDCDAGSVVIGAGAGAAVGALGGSIVGTQQQEYANNSDRLDAITESAEAHLSDARRARQAAESVVAAHKADLADLKDQYSKGQISQEDYRDRLEDARHDQGKLSNARDALSDQIYALDRELSSQSPSYKKDKLEGLREELAVERERLNQQLSDLTSDIDSAEALA